MQQTQGHGASKTVVVDLFWQEKRQFAFTVNAHVFNPIESIAGHKLVDLILSDQIEVADKNVIDLGCGSGVIGLCAIVKQAKRFCSLTSILALKVYKNILCFVSR